MLNEVDLEKALVGVLGHRAGVLERLVMQERLVNVTGQQRTEPQGRVVEYVRLDDGREVIV